MGSSGLGYMDLISMAEANTVSKKREMERKELLKKKEKKEDPKQVKLRVGVQNFLARREEEERKKKEEDLRKKEKLQELRNQDRKATTRVRRMVNMTKSANKSVMADAVESLDDKCNEQAGETQPDEDDYGYTSSYANDMYNKMIQKFKTDNQKKSTLDRSALSKIQSFPRRDKETVEEMPANDEQKSAKKIKRPAPPAPSFHDLLKLAEEKSKEPIVIKKPIKEVQDGEEFEFGRPMTSKEKARYLAELELKERAYAMLQKGSGARNPPQAPPLPSTNEPSKAPPSGDKTKFQMPSIPKKSAKENSNRAPPPPPPPPVPTKAKPQPQPQKQSLNQIGNCKLPTVESRGFPNPKPSTSSMPMPTPHSNQPPSHKARSRSDSPHGLVESFSNLHTNGAKPKKAEFRQNPPSVDTSRSRELNHSKKDALSSSKSIASRKPPSNIQDARPKPPSQGPSISKTSSNSRISNNGSGGPSKKRIPPRPYLDRDDPTFGAHLRPTQSSHHRKGRVIMESDEEYDSEMDDFIDDSEVPQEDISSVIGQLFGYNKRKYVNEESDDECMESSVAQQMFEEARTARLGKLEDEEDMRMEEQAKRKKAFMKKRKLI